MQKRWFGAVMVLVVLSVAGCGTTHQIRHTNVITTPSGPASQAPGQLTVGQLRAALLTPDEIPADGYFPEANPNSHPAGSMCGIQLGHSTTPRASELLAKGSATNFFFIGLGIHEFPSAAAARALFNSRVAALKTCTHFTDDHIVWSVRSSSLHGFGDAGVTLFADASSHGISVKSVNRAVLVGNTIVNISLLATGTPDPTLVDQLTRLQLAKLRRVSSGQTAA